MTFYEQKLHQIKAAIYSNEEQIHNIIGIRNYIDTNYDNASLTLDSLSRIGFVSKYHMLRLFKKYYGQTPRQYLIDKRITKAKELLQKEMSVTETCFAVGFESLGSFSSLFKNRMGKSPSIYRKEQLSRNNLHSIS